MMLKNEKQIAKEGISLIILVITVIVMIILATAIILSLNGSGIIGKANEAVSETNLKQIHQIAQVGWAEGYSLGKKTQPELESYVIQYLTNNGIDHIEQSKYDIDVTIKGVEVSQKMKLDDSWKESVVKIVNKVPIPKGFVASDVTGENTRSGGLVIYEGTEAVTEANVSVARTTRNQYVWIPVENFEVNFKKGIYNNTVSNYGFEPGTINKHWEIAIDPITNIPKSLQNTEYVSLTTLKEATEMYKSVNKYGGFYVSRYEASKKGVIAASVMNADPWDNIKWGDTMSSEGSTGAVGISRSIYPNTNLNIIGVVSTLMYGVQRDAIMNWMKDIDNQNVIGTKYITNSTGMGNYNGSEIKLNDGNIIKEADVYNRLNTGITNQTKVNNIYDLAGNVAEWTMDGYSNNGRMAKGGFYESTGSQNPASKVSANGGANSYMRGVGFRYTMYIK